MKEKTKEQLVATIIISKTAGISISPRHINLSSDSDYRCLTIAIGKDYTAELYIAKVDLEELRKYGEIIAR